MAIKKLSKVPANVGTAASAGHAPEPLPSRLPSSSALGNAPLTRPHAEAAAPDPVLALSNAELLTIIPNSMVTALIGDSGTGKSTCAETMPCTPELPQLVFAFDPPGKMYPYKAGYEAVPKQDAYYEELGIQAESILNAEGQEIRRIEYYIDPDPKEPRAAQQIENRLAGFEQQAPAWSSVVFDSMTFFQYASLRRQRFLFPMSPGKEQGMNLAWYNGVKGDVERAIKSQAVWWKTRVILIFHTSEEKVEFASETVRGLLAVGKLPGELPPGFTEMYRFYVTRLGTERKYLCQTRHDGLWAAASIIAHAPDPCEPDFRKLWGNFVKAAKGIE